MNKKWQLGRRRPIPTLSKTKALDGEKPSTQGNNTNTRSITSEWLESCREEYKHVSSQKRIADVLVEEYGEHGAGGFAREIADKAEPLWQPEAGESGAKKRYTFVRVFHKSEKIYCL